MFPPRLASLLLSLALTTQAALAAGQGASFIDYIRPMPIAQKLSTTVWGAAEVGARDPGNGLEDPTMREWNYWDGQVIKAKDGKYHLFASRWPQARGHGDWWNSKAVHAVSDRITGPYVDRGLTWPQNQDGKGHNVTALALPDGRYAIVVSETRPGEVFVSASLDGPWESLGLISVADNAHKDLGRMSNVSLMVRPDGRYQIVPRSGAVLISDHGILGPYTVQGESVYKSVPEMVDMKLEYLEDPVVWHSGGWYHIVVNDWYARRAYHLISADGITGWRYRGVAFDATSDFLRYADGTVNHWHKLERPGVVLDGGHVVALSLAVLDVAKERQPGNNGHGSKIIVVPFDGAAFDRDLPPLPPQPR